MSDIESQGLIDISKFYRKNPVVATWQPRKVMAPEVHHLPTLKVSDGIGSQVHTLGSEKVILKKWKNDRMMLSEYEEMRQKNIAEKLAMLQSLQIIKAKEGLPELQGKRKTKKLKLKAKKEPVSVRPPSHRLQILKSDRLSVPDT
ncbi:uncharacterized protein LOC106469925 [Limulus polyphemus]|uniref:Uncharacterized protein LOC106469925 n=1 Tax=Limulus polyphemus TaxID=6850 RepID=A0ABM1BP33_LIMPO|nr:uncharacterized protein LOC106469925 [Limulus polyphemus]